MYYSNTVVLRDNQWSPGRCLVREFDNLCSDFSLLSMDLPSKMDWILADGDLDQPG